ncbi:Anaerobic ribonucleoside triphosphate reductase [Corynebacterium pseudotuberculosis]|nr:Anaerobic ribonucleoside triphosphate reductase [Corynebacterium pseudotuberculosis]
MGIIPPMLFPMTESHVNSRSTIEEYLDRSDWRVNANANQDYSLGGMILNSAGKITANYWLDNVFSPEAGQAHRDGTIHIHDLDMLSGYCAGWSLRQLLEQGFNGVSGTISSHPPKHFSSACGQIVNFLGTLQNEWAGAQAFSSFDTYMAPFVRLDNLSYNDVVQQMQEFIFNLNVPSRWGTQTPFTNLTFDWTCPEDLQDQVPFIGEEPQPFTYGDLQSEMDIINRAFIEVMSAGDADGRPFTFPIPTYNITKDFDWDSSNSKALFTMTAKYGLPYFQNFINSDLDPGMIRSMCCRLQLDLRELLKRGNGLFGSAELTGSIGVVTLNCARLGYLHADDEEGLLANVDKLVQLGIETLERRRAFVAKQMDAGLYPYSSRWLPSLDNHFSTIGVNGCNEMIRNFTHDAYDLTDPPGPRTGLVAYLITSTIYWLKPKNAQATCSTLKPLPPRAPLTDWLRRILSVIPESFTQARRKSLITPIPPSYQCLIPQTPLRPLRSRKICNLNTPAEPCSTLYMGAAMSDGEACAKLVRRSLENFRLPYVTITPTFSICPTHGYISGEHPECPDCGEHTEMWTRVMGYFRPVQSFNTGKKGEFHERTYFAETLA